MTPQSDFMIAAPVAPGRADDLRRLLLSMNISEGVVDPGNALIPFGQFDTLHFARLVILDDQTLDDVTLHGGEAVRYPLWLALIADCDGPADGFAAELVARAGPGLRQIFSHCEDAPGDGDLGAWIASHRLRAAACYVNWIGRSVRQVREEAALADALGEHVRSAGAELCAMPAREARDALRRFVADQQRAGRLALTPPEPAPAGWQARNVLHLVGVPLLLLVLAPLILVGLPFFLVALRMKERRDPEYAPRIDPAHARALARLEDHDVTNQFSAMGSLKPGPFRRWTAVVLLWLIDYTTRHIYRRGRLARVNTIHFARWVFLDGRRRMFFASNYDGSLDSYMDDFINKVAFGLNLVFSNGIGYPRTDWLVVDGAKDEQKFKYYIRRHQLPTEVWYNAHPGLTALDLARNARIRDGLERASMSDAEARQWLQLL